jgi:hypothetical protein
MEKSLAKARINAPANRMRKSTLLRQRDGLEKKFVERRFM